MELLAVRPGGLYVDGTVGLGGPRGGDPAPQRARRPARSAFDRDAETLAQARERARALRRPRAPRARRLPRDPRAPGRRARPTACSLDLGVSSVQLDTAERGFSFQRRRPARHAHGPQPRGTTAADVVNRAARARAGRRHLPLRRGARVAPHRARHRADARRSAGTSRPRRELARRRAPRRRPLAPARARSRHPHLPGPAHPRQPRAGGAGRRAARASPAASRPAAAWP